MRVYPKLGTVESNWHWHSHRRQDEPQGSGAAAAAAVPLQAYCAERIPFVLRLLGRALLRYQRDLPDRSRDEIVVKLDGILRAVFDDLHLSAAPSPQTRAAILALKEDGLEKVMKDWSHLLKLDHVIDVMERHGFELRDLGPYIVEDAGPEALKYIIATSPIDEHRFAHRLSQAFGWSWRGLQVLGRTTLGTVDAFLWASIKTVYSVGIFRAVHHVFSWFLSVDGLESIISEAGINSATPLKIVFETLFGAARRLEKWPLVEWHRDMTKISIIFTVTLWVQQSIGHIVDSVALFFGGAVAAKVKRRVPSFLLPFVKLTAWIAMGLQRKMRDAPELPLFVRAPIYSWSARLITFYADELFPEHSSGGGVLSGWAKEDEGQASLRKALAEKRAQIAEDYILKKSNVTHGEIAEMLEKQVRQLEELEEVGGERVMSAGKAIAGYNSDSAENKRNAREIAMMLGAIGGEEHGLGMAYVDERSQSFWGAIVQSKCRLLKEMASAIRVHEASNASEVLANNAKSEAALSRAWAIASGSQRRSGGPQDHLISLLALWSTAEKDAFILRATAANAEAIHAMKNGDDAIPSLGKGWAFLQSFVKTVVSEGVGGVAQDLKLQVKRAAGGRGQIGPASSAFYDGSMFISALLSITGACVPPIVGWALPVAYSVFNTVPQITQHAIPTWTAVVGQAHTNARDSSAGQILLLEANEKPEVAFARYIRTTLKVLWAELRFLDSTAREGRLEAELESAYSHIFSSYQRAKYQALSTQLQLEMDVSQEVRMLRAESLKVEAERDALLLARSSSSSSSSSSSRRRLVAQQEGKLRPLRSLQQRQENIEERLRGLQSEMRSAVATRLATAAH